MEKESDHTRWLGGVWLDVCGQACHAWACVACVHGHAHIMCVCWLTGLDIWPFLTMDAFSITCMQACPTSVCVLQSVSSCAQHTASVSGTCIKTCMQHTRKHTSSTCASSTGTPLLSSVSTYHTHTHTHTQDHWELDRATRSHSQTRDQRRPKQVLDDSGIRFFGCRICRRWTKPAKHIHCRGS